MPATIARFLLRILGEAMVIAPHCLAVVLQRFACDFRSRRAEPAGRKFPLEGYKRLYFLIDHPTALRLCARPAQCQRHGPERHHVADFQAEKPRINRDAKPGIVHGFLIHTVIKIRPAGALAAGRIPINRL